MENKAKKNPSTPLIVILLCATIASLIITGNLSEIRMVVFIQILACGMLTGVLIINLLNREKKG